MDHDHADGFKEVRRRNFYLAAILIAIIAIIVADIWFTPALHDIEVRQSDVIPWSPHP